MLSVQGNIKRANKKGTVSSDDVGGRAGTSKEAPVDLTKDQSTFKPRKSRPSSRHAPADASDDAALSYLERVATATEEAQKSINGIGLSFQTIVTQFDALLHFQTSAQGHGASAQGNVATPQGNAATPQGNIATGAEVNRTAEGNTGTCE